MTKAAKKKISYKELEGTSWMRLLEMNVENSTAVPNNVALVMQFFQDLKLYGLDEAIAYAEGYERDGFFVAGTTLKLKEVKAKILKNLVNPMEKKDRYVIDDYKMEEIYNRFMKVENQLPYISSTKGVYVDTAWVEAMAEAAQIPVDVAYVWSVNEWIPDAILQEVKDKAKEIQESGKVVVGI